MIGADWYYFDETTCEAVSEKKFFNTITYKFEETGKLTSGEWALTNFGYKYYYGPDCYNTGFETIDGVKYYFNDYYKLEEGIFEFIIIFKYFLFIFFWTDYIVYIFNIIKNRTICFQLNFNFLWKLIN